MPRKPFRGAMIGDPLSQAKILARRVLPTGPRYTALRTLEHRVRLEVTRYRAVRLGENWHMLTRAYVAIDGLEDVLFVFLPPGGLDESSVQHWRQFGSLVFNLIPWKDDVERLNALAVPNRVRRLL